MFPYAVPIEERRECICHIWNGRQSYHDEEVTNEDDAIINILGSLGGQ